MNNSLKNCKKNEVKKCINECCKEVDVEVIKNFLGSIDRGDYLYEIIIKNNTNCVVKNVSLIDTFLVENSIIGTTTYQSDTINPETISLLSSTATLRTQGNITDPCNTCLPPCSVSRIYVLVETTYNIGNYVPNNIITLHGYIGDKCIKVCCNDCSKNNTKPVMNSNSELTVYITSIGFIP